MKYNSAVYIIYSILIFKWLYVEIGHQINKKNRKICEYLDV